MKKITAFHIFAIVLTVFFCAVRYIRFQEPMGLDQGLFAYFGRHILTGSVPYLDIWDSKPPGIFYIYSISFALLGDSFFSVYLIETLFLALTALLIYLLCAEVFDKKVALFAAAIYVLFSNAPIFDGFWSTAQAEVFMNLPIVASLYILTKNLRRWHFFASGVLLGLSVMFKLTALFLLPSFILYLYLSFKDKSPIEPPIDSIGGRDRIHRYTYFGIGLIIPLSICAFYFWMQGALDDMIYTLVSYSYRYSQAITQGQPFLKTSLGQFIRFVIFNPTVSILSLVGLIYLLVKRRSKETYLLISYLVLSFISVWAQRQFAGYHFIVLSPPLAVICGSACPFIFNWIVRSTSSIIRKRSLETLLRSSAAIITVVLLAFFLYTEMSRYYRYYRPDISYARGRISPREYLKTFDRGAISFLNNSSVADYIRDRTDSDDYVLVWGLAPAIYYLSDRKSPTKYVFHHVLLTDAPLSRQLGGLEGRRKEFLEKVTDSKPRYIVIGINDRNGFEPQDSDTQLLNFKEFKDYVFTNYDREKRIGNFILVRRKE